VTRTHLTSPMLQIHRLILTSLPLRGAIAAALIFILSGCSDRPPRAELRGEPLGGTADAPTMVAQESFFDGKLLVEANLGQGFGGRGGPDGGRPGGGAGSPRHHGERRRGPEYGGGGENGPGEPGGGATIHESSMQPVGLRLRLTNASQETVEVTFTLCKSELGDFAVRPEKISLSPGQTAEPEPMTSRLGLTSAELVLKVGLRMAGKAEQKELRLKTHTSAEPPPFNVGP